MRLALTGATGRMGRTVLERARAAPEWEVVLAASRQGAEVATPAGDSLVDEADLPTHLRDREPAVLVDFTAPTATARYASAAADAGVAFVTGTTGFDPSQERSIEAAAGEVPVLDAPNFAPGVTVLRQLVGAAATALPHHDVEVVETHHGGKRDAPSGTANSLVDAVRSARNGGRPVHGRSGEAPRRPDEIGVHAVRAGDVAGEHRVVLAGDGETLSLTHRVGGREVFAAGALEAAAWLTDREPGRYAFADVLEGAHDDAGPEAVA